MTPSRTLTIERYTENLILQLLELNPVKLAGDNQS